MSRRISLIVVCLSLHKADQICIYLVSIVITTVKSLVEVGVRPFLFGISITREEAGGNLIFFSHIRRKDLSLIGRKWLVG